MRLSDIELEEKVNAEHDYETNAPEKMNLWEAQNLSWYLALWDLTEFALAPTLRAIEHDISLLDDSDDGIKKAFLAGMLAYLRSKQPSRK